MAEPFSYTIHLPEGYSVLMDYGRNKYSVKREKRTVTFDMKTPLPLEAYDYHRVLSAGRNILTVPSFVSRVLQHHLGEPTRNEPPYDVTPPTHFENAPSTYFQNAPATYFDSGEAPLAGAFNREAPPPPAAFKDERAEDLASLLSDNSQAEDVGDLIPPELLTRYYTLQEKEECQSLSHLDPLARSCLSVETANSKLF